VGRKALDLTGKKFGSLLVVDRAGFDKHGNARWNCICDCGKKIVVSGGRLTRISTPKTHCGCLTSQHMSDAHKGKPCKIKDLTGQRFGSLLIIDRAGSNERGKATWNYVCDCGKKGVARTEELTRSLAAKTHCGCLTSKHISDCQKGNLSNLYKHGQSRTLEYKAIYQARRRIKKHINKSGSTRIQKELFKIARPKLDYCVYCGSTDNLTIDHIIPIDKGGTQDPKNLIRACGSCNSAKRNSFFIDWYIKSKRCKRSLIEIIIDMGFDSIFHLQHYQDSMCPDYYEKNRSMVAAKLIRAEKKSIRLLDRYYQSLDHYPTH